MLHFHCGATARPVPLMEARGHSNSMAVPSNLDSSSLALICLFSLRSFSAQSAAIPATCGVAMLVPDIVDSSSTRPTDRTETPGPQIFAPLFENHAMQ